GTRRIHCHQAFRHISSFFFFFPVFNTQKFLNSRLFAKEPHEMSFYANFRCKLAKLRPFSSFLSIIVADMVSEIKVRIF
ncbi:MAG: hypothetical protein MJ175_05815, partial [Clostridia bacterium]|nr:hypothetical protein [Clostridia bacterium]